MHHPLEVKQKVIYGLDLRVFVVLKNTYTNSQT